MLNHVSDIELICESLSITAKDREAVTQWITENKGIGGITATSIQALTGAVSAKTFTKIKGAIEFSRRLADKPVINRPKFTCSRDIHEHIAGRYSCLDYEVFDIMFLNRANECFAIRRLSTGGSAGTVVEVKMVMRMAVETGAAGLILIHNHPSGSLKPSRTDIGLTHKISAAGKLLEILVLDHLIISDLGCYSFADEGMMV